MRTFLALTLIGGLTACTYAFAEVARTPSETFFVVRCENQKLTVANADPYWDSVVFTCTKDHQLRIKEAPPQ